MEKSVSGPLSGLKVLDLSRVLAGPWATQTLADFGATVWKIERPSSGDDTRRWGNEIHENVTAYFLSANRGKHSLTIDISTEKGQCLIRELVMHADILVENFKVGNLSKYGLDYDNLHKINPKIIYCSITGFGQNGPFADQAGYDAMIQASAGLMNITGEPDGNPQKVGVAVSDLMTGMYAVSAILAAIYHREQSGEGQWIDLALFDTQVSWLANQSMNYLHSGEVPQRQGSVHPNIAPYQPIRCSDGMIMLAVGNNTQFEVCWQQLGLALEDDRRFETNNLRIEHRVELIELIEEITVTNSSEYWLDRLSNVQVPCGPINDMKQVFEHPQIAARKTRFSIKHPVLGDMPQVANPVKFSKTPINYHKSAPILGEDSQTVLAEILGYSDIEIVELQRLGIV